MFYIVLKADCLFSDKATNLGKVRVGKVMLYHFVYVHSCLNAQFRAHALFAGFNGRVSRFRRNVC
jgi:hypothetical protein